jgi:hypothetical protein
MTDHDKDDAERFRTVVKLLSGIHVQDASRTLWLVRTPVAPKAEYPSTEAEFIAAIDAAREVAR